MLQGQKKSKNRARPHLCGDGALVPLGNEGVHPEEDELPAAASVLPDDSGERPAEGPAGDQET